MSLSRQELAEMPRDEVVAHVEALQSSAAIRMRLHDSILKKIPEKSLIAFALKLQDEIDWQRVQAITRGGAG